MTRAGITLATEQRHGHSRAAGTKPTVGGTATLATGAQVHALDISAGTSTGLSGSGVTGVTVGQGAGLARIRWR